MFQVTVLESTLSGEEEGNLPWTGPWISRLISLVLLLVTLVQLLACYKGATLLSGSTPRGVTLSARGGLLLNALMVGFLYCVVWLPLLIFKVVDLRQESDDNDVHYVLEWGKVIHCYLQEMSSSSFLNCLVVSSFLYLRFKEMGVRGRWWVRNLVVGLLVPQVLSQVTWVLVGGREWFLPSQLYSQRAQNHTIIYETAAAFCEKRIDRSWLRSVLVEWLVTLALVQLPLRLHHYVIYNHHCSPDLEASCLPNHEGGRPLYARGLYLLETCCVMAVVWCVALRPLLAFHMSLLLWQRWSSYLEIPAHVLLMSLVILVPFEVDLEDEGEDEDKEICEAHGQKSESPNPKPTWQTDENINERNYDSNDLKLISLN